MLDMPAYSVCKTTPMEAEERAPASILVRGHWGCPQPPLWAERGFQRDREGGPPGSSHCVISSLYGKELPSVALCEAVLKKIYACTLLVSVNRVIHVRSIDCYKQTLLINVVDKLSISENRNIIGFLVLGKIQILLVR